MEKLDYKTNSTMDHQNNYSLNCVLALQSDQNPMYIFTKENGIPEANHHELVNLPPEFSDIFRIILS